MVVVEGDARDKSLRHCHSLLHMLGLPRHELEAVLVADKFSIGELVPAVYEVIRQFDELVSDLESVGWVR